jgi:hypothetical protein
MQRSHSQPGNNNNWLGQLQKNWAGAVCNLFSIVFCFMIQTSGWFLTSRVKNEEENRAAIVFFAEGAELLKQVSARSKQFPWRPFICRNEIFDGTHRSVGAQLSMGASPRGSAQPCA